ncbi:MAG: PAS domain-containing sensor histidine kinase [Ignavibacteria bacterium]|nr:PAS domain-containing sensor histidine kinase [Ignavibacteria bacterium]MDH7526901.1 PAS domain-containing sensor histidine kinase [Ignavibacteria bacterium]
MEQKTTVFTEENHKNSGIIVDSIVFWTFSVPDQKLLFVSSNIEKWTGYKSEDFYLNPKLWLNLIQNYETITTSRKISGDQIVFESLYSIKSKNYGEVKVQEILIPILNENEELIQIQAYLKMRKTKENLIEIKDEIFIPYFEAEYSNSQLKILKASRQFFDLMELRLQDSNKSSEAFQKFLKLLLEKVLDLKINNYSRFEYELNNDDGARIYLFDLNLIEKDNEKIKFTGAGIDITELKLNELRLQKLNNDKNKLLTIVSHDLKAPFNTILNFINLINDGVEIDEEQKKEYLKYIYDSAKQQIELIHDLLDWSKVEAGLLEFSPKCLKLQSILNKVISGFSGQIYQKGIQVILDFDKETKVFFDKNYLKIVLSNIISNAVKFSHRNGKIIISAKEEKNFTTIQIEDFGIGFSERYLRQLTGNRNFEIQIGTMGEKGTGFGLRFCYDIIQSNHGKLMIETESQKGTKVIIKLRKPDAKVVYFDDEAKLIEIKNQITKFQPEIYFYLCKDLFDLLNFVGDNSPEFIILNFDLIKSFQKSFIEKILIEINKTSKLIVLSSELNENEELNFEFRIDAVVDRGRSRTFILEFLKLLSQQIRNGKEIKDIKIKHLSL